MPNKIRKIDENGIIRTVVGTGTAGFNGDGQVGLATAIAEPRGFFLNPDDSIIFTDANNHRVRRFGNALSGLFPARIPSSDGSEIYFFNAQGLHEKTFFADTGAVKYEFVHGDGNLLNAVKDAFQNTLTIQRDSQGNLQSMTGPYGQIYQFSVDQNNYLSSVTDPLNNTHSMTYTPDGLMLSFTRPEGNSSTYEFDNSGRLTKATEPNGGYKILTRLSDDSVELRTSENVISRFKNETLSSIPEFTHYQEDGGVFKNINISQFGFTRSTTPSKMQVDRQIFTDQRFPGFSTYQGSADTKYTTFNDAIHRSFAAKNYIFNSDGVNFIRNSGTSDNAGFSMNSAFDSASKSITTTTGAGRSTFATISNQEKLTSLKLGLNLATNFSYDNRGRLSEISQGDRLTKLSYDQFGFLNQIIDPENRVTRFVNDAIGRTQKTISADLNETKIDYDRNSNITGITPPQRLLHQFVNNTIDFLASYTAPESAGSRTFQYDSDKRLRSIATEENSPININFGNIDGNQNNNKITGLSIPNFTINYQHHPEFKWLAEAESTDQIKITYDRRGDDILFSKSYSGRFSALLGYAYNQSGLMQTSESINSVQLNQNFNADKLLIQNGNLYINRDSSTGLPVNKFLGSRAERISYNEYGEIASRQYQLGNVTTYSETYTRDKLGRITNKAIFKNNVTNNQSFQYDLKGRLLTFSVNGVLRNSFTYDAQGNRLNSSATNYTAMYNSRDRLTEFTNNSKRTTFTYSEDDQHIVKNEIDDSIVTTYDISGLNALQKVEIVSPAGTKTITYLIDGENKRSAKLVDGVISTFFIYDKYQRLIAELNPDSSVRSRFIYGTQSHSPDYMIRNNEELFFIKDQLGSILQVVNSSGVVRQELQYGLFGGVQSDSNSGFQPFGFAGGHYDWETGLVRFGARDYDAEMGRWLVRDPIGFKGGDSNLYAYAGNDPINRIDPSGLETESYSISVSISAGGLGFTASVSYNTDDKGNSNISYTTGAGPSMRGASATLDYQTTNAANICSLKGNGTQSGLSIYGPGGGAANYITGDGYTGFEQSVGIGTSGPGASSYQTNTEFFK